MSCCGSKPRGSRKKAKEGAVNQPISGGVSRHLLAKPARKGSDKVAKTRPVGRPSAESQMTAREKKLRTLDGANAARIAKQERAKLDARFLELAPTVAHPSGKVRTYEQCCMYLTVFCRLYEKEKLRLIDAGTPNERIKTRSLARMASRATGFGIQTGRDVAEQFLEDGTVLVASTENNGRGSPNYIDNARLLSADHLKFIDEQVDKVHDEGGALSVPVLRDMLMTQFPDLSVTPGAVHYAMVHFCNGGEGYVWGDIKTRKCESDPERINVKRTYLRDLSFALQKQHRGEAILVFVDESYIHQNHAPRRCWLKPGVGGAYINRGSSKGKRLIFIHGALLLLLCVILCVMGNTVTSIVAAITKDGPLCVKSEDGPPLPDFKFGEGLQKDTAYTEECCTAGRETAELLWTASQHKGDYHDNSAPPMLVSCVSARWFADCRLRFCFLVCSELGYVSKVDAGPVDTDVQGSVWPGNQARGGAWEADDPRVGDCCCSCCC
eukprot:COSAG05_NODE_23_length_31591_cov_92.542995_26_plen_495_part_00